MQNKYAAKIDLSSFFDDERKFVLILIDSAWENVECLQKRIEKIFDIEGVRFATKDGYFLPPQENIEVVKFADVIKAFIPSESLVKKRKKSKKSTQATQELQQQLQATEGDETLQLTGKKKRKYASLDGFLCSTPNQAKRTKNIQNIHVTLPFKNNKTNEITSTSEPLEEIGKKKKCPHTLQSFEEVPVEQTKQRSLKKKKKQSCIEISHADNSMNRSGFRKSSQHFSEQIPSSTLLQENSKSEKQQCTISNENSDSSQHIFYDESGGIVSTTTQKNANETMQDDCEDKASEKDVSSMEKIIMRSPLEEKISQKPRVFEIKAKRATIEIREQIFLTNLITNDESITHSRDQSNATIETEPIELHQTTLELIGGEGKEEEEEESVADVVKESVANNSAQSDASISNMQQTSTNSTMEQSDAIISIIEESAANYSNVDQSNAQISIEEQSSINSIMEQSDAKNSIMEKSDTNNSKQTSTNSTMEQSDDANNSTLEKCDANNSNVDQSIANISNMQQTSNNSTMEQSDANISTLGQSVANISTMAKNPLNKSNIEDEEAKLSSMKPKNANNSSSLEHIDANFSTVGQSTKNKVSIEKSNVSFEKTQEELEVSSIIDLDEEEDDDDDTSYIIDSSEAEYDENPSTSKQRSRNRSSANTSKQARDLMKKLEDKLTIKEMLPFSIALEKMPQLNDIVLFKAFCSGKGFLTTKYIAGKCEYTNKRTKNIKLAIIDGQSQVHRLPSKFIVDLDDSVSEILYVNLKLADMLEPRLFSLA